MGCFTYTEANEGAFFWWEVTSYYYRYLWKQNWGELGGQQKFDQNTYLIL